MGRKKHNFSSGAVEPKVLRLRLPKIILTQLAPAIKINKSFFLLLQICGE